MVNGVIFDKDNTEHTAEVERCVKAAKAQTPPITESAALLAEVLQNSTIKFRTDNAKNKRKVSRYISNNFCTAADLADNASWHKYATPASPLDELIMPVLLVGTLTVIAYFSCMRQNVYYGPTLRDRSTIGFAPDAMKGETDEEKDKAAKDAALFETLVCLLMHPDHEGQEKFIKDRELRKRVMKEVKKRIKAKGVVAPIQGGAKKNIGPGMRLSKSRKKIEVQWVDGGVRRVEKFQYNAAGRRAAAEFVLKNCGKAVRYAQLEANRKAKAANQPLPYAIGQAVVDTYAGRATHLPGFNVSGDSSSDDDEPRAALPPRRRATAAPAAAPTSRRRARDDDARDDDAAVSEDDVVTQRP